MWGKWLEYNQDWVCWFYLTNICCLNAWCIFGQGERTCWEQFINRRNEIQRARAIVCLFALFCFQSFLKWPYNNWNYDYNNILLSFHLLCISNQSRQLLRIWCRIRTSTDLFLIQNMCFIKSCFKVQPLKDSQMTMVHLKRVYFSISGKVLLKHLTFASSWEEILKNYWSVITMLIKLLNMIGFPVFRMSTQTW